MNLDALKNRIIPAFSPVIYPIVFDVVNLDGADIFVVAARDAGRSKFFNRVYSRSRLNVEAFVLVLAVIGPSSLSKSLSVFPIFPSIFSSHFFSIFTPVGALLNTYLFGVIGSILLHVCRLLIFCHCDIIAFGGIF